MNPPVTSKLSSETLFSSHGQRVLRLLHRLGVATSDLEDQLQEVFAIVAKSGGFDDSGPAKPMTWLTSVALKVVANYRRAARRRKAGYAAYEGAPREDAPSLPQVVHTNERRALLLDALARLPAEQRDLIVLFELEGEDCKTIADRSGSTVGAIHSRLSRARQSLRRAVTELEDIHPPASRAVQRPA